MMHNLLAIIILCFFLHNQIQIRFYNLLQYLLMEMQQQNQQVLQTKHSMLQTTIMREQIDSTQILSSLSETKYYSQVVQSFSNLQQIIQSLNQKVEAVIQQSSGQFLLAYQNHIRKINHELALLKKKADQSQQQMKQSSKLVFLQKQVSIFRDQALRLYDRLEEKTQQSQIYKLRSKQLQKTCYITQKQIRQALKCKKTLQAKVRDGENKIKLLEEQLTDKNYQLLKVTALPSQANTKTIQTKKYSFRQQSQTKQVTKNNKSMLYSQNKKRLSEHGFMPFKYGDNQLKQWFVQCLKSIKKDVAYRKNSGYQFDLTEIKNINDFKMVDKLKLLQKFMQNQKLLTWMYQKIFPSRTDQIREYFSVKKLSDNYNFHQNQNQNQQQNQNQSQHQQRQRQRQQNATINTSQLIKQLGINDEQANSYQSNKIEVILPKMKASKNQVRNRIAIREGKLSLSNI